MESKSEYTYVEGYDEGIMLHSALSGASVFVTKEHEEDVRKLLLGLDGEVDSRIREGLRRGKFISTRGQDEEDMINMWTAWQSARAVKFIVIASEDCNFRCRYCYESFRNVEIGQEVCEALIELARNKTDLERLSIDWFGGEPLLAVSKILDTMNSLREIAEERGFVLRSSMTTNGYLLVPETFAKLVKCGVSCFQITVDGFMENHDRNRIMADGEGSYKTIMNNLCAMRDSPLDFEIHIRHNFDAGSLPQLDKFLEYLAEEFAPDSRFSIGLHAIANLCGAKVVDPDIIPVAKGKHVDMESRKVAVGLGMREHFTEKAMKPLGSICYAADPNCFVLSTDGQLMKCTVSLKSDPMNIVGRLMPDGSLQIDEAKHSPWLVPHALEGNNKCQECWFKPACMGAQCPKEWLEHGGCTCPPEKLFPRDAFDILLLARK